MKGRALCHGAATIITGFATGRGGAYGLDLENRTSVEFNGDGGIESSVNGRDDVGLILAEAAVRRTCERFGVDYQGAKVVTESNVPHAAGLKSSSIAANSIVLATAALIAEEKGSIEMVRLSKAESFQRITIGGEEVKDFELINIGIEAAFDAKVTTTGALDDASAAYFGGYTLTRNLDREIAQYGGIEELDAVIYLPDEKIFSGSVKPEDVKPFAKDVDLLWDAARSGSIYSAITLNGLIHCAAFSQDVTPAKLALGAGAICAGLSGTGPSVVALCREDAESVVDAWKELDGSVLTAKTNNKKAEAIK